MSADSSVSTASRYSSRRTLRNGALSAVQVLVVGGTLLLAYRLALTEASREEFGLYATMFAVGTLTQLGTLGFASGASRHMAKAVGEGSAQAREQVLVSSVGMSLAGSMVMSVVLLGGLDLYRGTLDPTLDAVAAQLIPVVVAAAFVTPVSTAVQGVADGLGQAHVRSIVMIAASFVFYAVVALSLEVHGVVSLAWAALVQQSLVMCVLLAVVVRDSRCSRASRSWSPSLWRDMRRFNLKFQLMTVPALALEPLAKILLGAFAGFSAVATFEVANRLMQQVNAVILAANQAVVPLLAFRSAAGDLEDVAVFRRLYRTAWIVSLASFAAALVMLVPLGSFVFGESDSELIGFGLVLCAGWLANALSGPAYFISVTTNNFNASVVANYLMITVPAVLGVPLGLMLGGIGVATAVSLGLITAGYVINRAFLGQRDLGWSAVLTSGDAFFALVVVALVTAAVVAQMRPGSPALVTTLAVLGVLGVAALVRLRQGPVWSVITRREG